MCPWFTCPASHRYEDLKNDVEGSVIKMLDFLKYPYNEMEVKKKLSEDFGTFKRYCLLVFLCALHTVCVYMHVCVCL